MASGTLKKQSGEQKEGVMENNTYEYGSGIPEELEYIPEGYTQPAKQQGNLAFREREGYVHDGTASDEYTYNGLRFFWNQ